MNAEEEASIVSDIDTYTVAFEYHKPGEAQIEQIKVLRLHAKAMAYCIIENCPNCADRNAALRKVREALMTANAAIVLKGLV